MRLGAGAGNSARRGSSAGIELPSQRGENAESRPEWDGDLVDPEVRVEDSVDRVRSKSSQESERKEPHAVVARTKEEAQPENRRRGQEPEGREEADDACFGEEPERFRMGP